MEAPGVAARAASGTLRRRSARPSTAASCDDALMGALPRTAAHLVLGAVGTASPWSRALHAAGMRLESPDGTQCSAAPRTSSARSPRTRFLGVPADFHLDPLGFGAASSTLSTPLRPARVQRPIGLRCSRQPCLDLCTTHHAVKRWLASYRTMDSAVVGGLSASIDCPRLVCCWGCAEDDPHIHTVSSPSCTALRPPTCTSCCLARRRLPQALNGAVGRRTMSRELPAWPT